MRVSHSSILSLLMRSKSHSNNAITFILQQPVCGAISREFMCEALIFKKNLVFPVIFYYSGLSLFCVPINTSICFHLIRVTIFETQVTTFEP